MHRVVGAAVLRSGASSPTDAMSPARTAIACAKREVASSVMILPLWRMRSGGSIDRQSRAFSDALPPPLMLRSLAALALRGVSKHGALRRSHASRRALTRPPPDEGERPLTDIRRSADPISFPPVAEGPMNLARLKRRAVITLLGGAAALLAASILALGSAAAQTYPSRPITLVVPFPPGGATDAIARIIQDSMSQSLGQQLVIENIGGAGGMIAAGRAARAAPDGYTVLLHQVALAAGMTLYPNLGFDAEKDFVSIGLINTAASTLAARSTLPPNNIAELVRWMKEPGQNPKIAHPGVGSFGHLAG
ncbi:MAG: hypothetical protein E6G76_27785, partial [Alphaproteobacteria bacterium]